MPTYAPNFVKIPCGTGVGTTVNVVDSALRGRVYRPQPFNIGGGVSPSFVERDTFFPDGFIGHEYDFVQEFIGPPTATIITGALPPGLSLSTDSLTNTWKILGIPTTVGTYTATINITSTGTTVQYPSQIIINPDPDQGSLGVGGI